MKKNIIIIIKATSVAHLTNFSFEFFYEMFTEDASLLLLYHGAKKSKMTVATKAHDMNLCRTSMIQDNEKSHTTLQEGINNN